MNEIIAQFAPKRSSAQVKLELRRVPASSCDVSAGFLLNITMLLRFRVTAVCLHHSCPSCYSIQPSREVDAFDSKCLGFRVI